jgi:cysteine desulfurase
MASVTSTALRQASLLCAKQVSSAGLKRATTLPRTFSAISQKSSRRGYVSESKKNDAQVSVESTIMADQKKFMAETGKAPSDVSMPGTSADAGAMMDPMAGM